MTTNKKTSINIDPNLWKEWSKFVIDKTGSSRKASKEVENAIKEYMKKYTPKGNNP
jgi:metal-responsive CopG/Arc/MetJ family transcriptional regulator